MLLLQLTSCLASHLSLEIQFILRIKPMQHCSSFFIHSSLEPEGALLSSSGEWGVLWPWGSPQEWMGTSCWSMVTAGKCEGCQAQQGGPCIAPLMLCDWSGRFPLACVKEGWEQREVAPKGPHLWCSLFCVSTVLPSMFVCCVVLVMQTLSLGAQVKDPVIL